MASKHDFAGVDRSMSKRRRQSKEVDSEISHASSSTDIDQDPSVTVYDYLKQECDQLVLQLLHHNKMLVKRVEEEAEEGILELKDAYAATNTVKTISCVPGHDLTAMYNAVLRVVEGPYAGLTFEIKPRRRRPVHIGRSTGKKFKSGGVSLPNDASVSTTHAKISIGKEGEVMFTDQSSTNGSWLNDEHCVQQESYPVQSGDVLRVGDSAFECTLVVVE